MYAICYRYMGNAEVAKDALQDSLVQVLKSMDKYEERGLFKAWIGNITTKKCLDNLRKEKRHRYSDIENVVEPYECEIASLKLEQEDVLKFLDIIPENYRIAINMFLIEGCSHKEIGAHLNISEGGSRSLVSRGRKMIIEAFTTVQERERIQMNKTYSSTSDDLGKLRVI